MSMVGLNAGGILNADMATLRVWLAAGWRWWLGELAALVPARWRQRRIGRLAGYAYEPAAGALTLLPGGGSAPGRMPIAVVLPPALTLIRTVDYPAVREADLASLIALDAERIMPQGGAAVLGARVRTRDALTGRMQVDVAGLPLARAQALVAVLAGLPRAPAHVFAGAPEAPGSPQPAIDLLPALRRAGLIAGGDRSATPLWLIVGFAFLLNLGLLIWRDHAALDDLAATVDQQQPAVEVAQRIVARMRADDGIVRATAQARAAREPVALLARIDQALPPGTWIQRLSWQGDAQDGQDGTAAVGTTGSTGPGDTLLIAGYHSPHADVSGALRRAGLAVTRYGDTAQEAPSPLGEPFEVTVKLGGR